MEGTQLETVLNSKRQRRPSVRLGEIGDVPLAFFLENRPLKRRKKRSAGTVASAALVPAVVEEDDGNMEAVDFEEDDDPSGVDMTGFNLRDSARLETCWPQKTKPLEEVEVAAAAAAEEISEEGLMVEIAGGNNNVDEPEPEYVDEAGVENGKKGSEKRKKRSVKKGKRRAGAASKSWRARKVAAEEVARKAMSKKAAEASLLSENGSDSVLKDQDQDHEQEEDHKEESDKTSSAREEDQGDEQERQPDGLTETGGEKQDTSQEKNVLEDSLDSDVGDVLGDNYEGAIVIVSQEKQEQQQEQRQQQQEQQQQKEEGHLADESFVLPGFVKKWLEERRLGKFSDLFECHEVDEEVLPLLTMEDLREMGVQTVGSRRKLLHAIQGLSSKNAYVK